MQDRVVFKSEQVVQPAYVDEEGEEHPEQSYSIGVIVCRQGYDSDSLASKRMVRTGLQPASYLSIIYPSVYCVDRLCMNLSAMWKNRRKNYLFLILQLLILSVICFPFSYQPRCLIDLIVPLGLEAQSSLDYALRAGEDGETVAEANNSLHVKEKKKGRKKVSA